MRVKVSCAEGAEETMRDALIDLWLGKPPDAIPASDIKSEVGTASFTLTLKLNDKQKKKLRKTIKGFRWTRLAWLTLIRTNIGWATVLRKVDAKMGAQMGRNAELIRLEELKK